MDGSTPQHYQISDFLKWYDDKELILNPSFQRGSVWTPFARSYLIDSILRGYPIPKLLLRTSVDRNTRRTIRDVVDGQQRLRTIIDFANNKLVLGAKAAEFNGMRYADLDPDQQDAFLAYKLTCEQLINAADEDVLEVFARINSYAVPVNEAERRNAEFTGEFSGYVKDIAKVARPTLREGVLSEREIVRMVDQSLVAELIGFYIRGVTDGAEKDITKLYHDHNDPDFDRLPAPEEVVGLINRTAVIMGPLMGQPISKRPHFLMASAALLYMDGKLPEGRVDWSSIPAAQDLAPLDQIQNSLSRLNDAIESAEAADREGLVEFRDARSTTQRMKSRNVRLSYLIAAFGGAR